MVIAMMNGMDSAKNSPMTRREALPRGPEVARRPMRRKSEVTGERKEERARVLAQHVVTEDFHSGYLNRDRVSRVASSPKLRAERGPRSEEIIFLTAHSSFLIT